MRLRIEPSRELDDLGLVDADGAELRDVSDTEVLEVSRFMSMPRRRRQARLAG
jgi:hypothetical protein